MKEKTYTTEANDKEQFESKNVCYTYFGSRVEIDGIGYPVVAAIPFGKFSRQLPTATEKLQKLVARK